MISCSTCIGIETPSPPHTHTHPSSRGKVQTERRQSELSAPADVSGYECKHIHTDGVDAATDIACVLSVGLLVDSSDGLHIRDSGCRVIYNRTPPHASMHVFKGACMHACCAPSSEGAQRRVTLLVAGMWDSTINHQVSCQNITAASGGATVGSFT